jgi:hypothetical protein|tara:strand:- start:908 stop:1312 length:405 start_codon:yes stop_codon:yes gene_type:complete
VGESSPVKKTFGSFKALKKDKKKQKQNEDMEMENAGGKDDEEMQIIKSNLAEIQKISNKEQPLYTDKIMNDLMSKTVILNDFQDFPSLACTVTGSLAFNHYSKHKTIRDVNETRMEYFAQRLMQAEERVFSHAD